jgi:hypothetical protein
MIYEYKTIRVPFRNTGENTTELLHNEMHKLACLGWELVSVVHPGVNCYRLFFKRQILDETDND